MMTLNKGLDEADLDRLKALAGRAVADGAC